MGRMTYTIVVAFLAGAADHREEARADTSSLDLEWIRVSDHGTVAALLERSFAAPEEHPRLTRSVLPTKSTSAPRGRHLGAMRTHGYIGLQNHNPGDVVGSR